MDTHSRRTSVAILYPGDERARARADLRDSRFAALSAELQAAGVHVEAAVYRDEVADEVARQLTTVDIVLVWYNPIEGGRRRDRLDQVLRDAARKGAVVSAHPDVILKLGTKDVLLAVHALPFGSDAVRIGSLQELADDLPSRLKHGPRVLKQHRGQSGVGVWRVEASSDGFDLRHAQRGAEAETVDLTGLLQRMAPYFDPESGGHMIDQAWQPRMSEGMVRAYLVRDQVCGFGFQRRIALGPTSPGQPDAQPGERLYYGPEHPPFQDLRNLLDTRWVAQLCAAVGLQRDRLPMLWDCDFLFGARAPDQPEQYVLCEINVSSVSPFPDACIGPMVAAVQRVHRPD